jgi:uncharacterized protein (TIGR03086 family)
MTRSAPADRFQRAADGFAARIRVVPDDRWTSSSPCPGWTARDVAVHVINEARRILATVRGAEPQALYGVPVVPMGELPAAAPDAELATAFERISTELVEAIDDPVCQRVPLPTPAGPVPFADCVEALPEDVLIHTWDLARATGGDERLDPDLVAHVHAHLEPMDEMLRQPWAFGPKVPPPAGADAQTRFLCFVGRDPGGAW